jgi:hypothetical protein
MRGFLASALLASVFLSSLGASPSTSISSGRPFLSAKPALAIPIGESASYYDAAPGARLGLELPIAGPFFAKAETGYSLVPLLAGPAVSLLEIEAGGGLSFSPFPFLSANTFAELGYYHSFLREGASIVDGGGACVSAGLELKAAIASSFVVSLELAYAADLGLHSGLRLGAGLAVPLDRPIAERPISGERGIHPLALRAAEGEDSVSSLLSLRSGYAIPLGASSGYYEGGLFAVLSSEYPLSIPGLTLVGEMSYQGSPLKAGPLLSVVGAKAGLGESFEFLPGFGARLRASGGYSYAFVREGEDTVRGGSGAFAAGGGLFLSVTPAFILGLDGEYAIDVGLQSSLRLALGASLLLGGGAGGAAPAGSRQPSPASPKPTPLVAAAPAEPLVVESAELDAVFPVFRKYYDANPVGKLVVRNSGSIPIENLRASLLVRQYMDIPKESPALSALAPGQSAEIELFALFTDRILEATEATLASAETTVEYESGGVKRTASRNGSLRVLDRNALTWKDDRGAAAFVTPRDPAVMGFAKNVASLVAGKDFSAVDKNLLSAIAIHEALRSLGLSYMVDPKSPYADRSQARTEVDYLQFPRQTLEYRAGDCDDLSILYCALLEALGVDTAFITVPGHIFMAFALTGTGAEAARRYQKPDELVLFGGRAWVPIEVTLRTSGFLEAWQAGAKEWREARARDLAKAYPLREAWAAFEPVALPGASAATAMKTEEVVARYKAEARRFVEREIAPQVVRLQAEARKAQDSPSSLNALGALYARYGLFDKAEAEFEKAAAKGGYAPAFVNLGNIAFLGGDAAKAESFYARAYAAAPKDPGVLLAVARVNFELENYGLAKKAYEELKKIDPALADRFAYLELRGEDAARAADAAGAKEEVVWHE